MDILICVKQVPDDSVEIRLDPETMLPDLSRADNQASAFETYGLEMAARYTEANGGSVTVISMGDDSVVSTVRNCLAVGAGGGYVVSSADIPDADSHVTALALKAAIGKITQERGKPYDLILLGRESTDHIDGEVGPILAAEMELPLVTNVVDFSENGSGIIAKKEMDSGYQMVEAGIPCIITASKPNYDPRYPTIKSKLAARKIEIPVISFTDAETGDMKPRVSYEGYIDPPKRSGGVKFADLEPEAAADKLIEMIVKDKVL